MRYRPTHRRHRSVGLRLRLGELHRPTRVTILLPRRRHQARVEDLTRHGEIAAFLQPRVKYREQLRDRSGFAEQLAEQPDRRRVRRLVRKSHVEEAHERQPVADLELRLVVGEVVERLQHQDLEHQHAIVRRAPAAGPVVAVQRLLQPVAERLERHDLLQSNQRVTRFRQRRIPIVEIKEPRLRRHLALHRFTRHSESPNRARHQRFFEVSSSPAFVRAPEGNGYAERVIRTLKENLLWLRTFETVEELCLALLAFRETYNTTWLIERHGFITPAAVRQNQLQSAALAA